MYKYLLIDFVADPILKRSIDENFSSCTNKSSRKANFRYSLVNKNSNNNNFMSN